MAETTAEEWRPVHDAPGYEVSNLGRVRTVDRVVVCSPRPGSRMMRTHARTYAGRILTPAIDTGRVAYAQVHLTLADGSRCTRRVHVLVAEAFLGPRPAGMVCCHRDDDPRNNRAENLRWGTYASNTAEAIANGRRIGRPKAAAR